jgi:putative ABC transport system substrate-binding protein
MRRREFIAGLSGAAAWPVVARGQKPAMPVIGFLDSGTPNESLITAFRGGLGEMGFVEGHNVVIEFRFAGGHYDSLPTLAADLVARQVAAIAAMGVPPARAAKAATSQIPIIFLTGVDPVQLGLVSNLNRPEGNVTGVTGLKSSKLISAPADVSWRGLLDQRRIVWRPASSGDHLTRRSTPTTSQCQRTVPLRTASLAPPRSG